jgi:hypothetical protein
MASASATASATAKKKLVVCGGNGFLGTPPFFCPRIETDSAKEAGYAALLPTVAGP